MPFQAFFDLDIPEAIQDQLVELFEGLEPARLADAILDGPLGVPRAPGVYGLYHRGELVYIGKAGDLGKRIDEHRRKIGARQNIDLDDMGFVCVTVHHNWTPFAPETILQRYYKPQRLIRWNGTGFGQHDPGRERETTNKPPDGWDRQFPIRQDFPCDWIQPGEHSVLDVLIALKEGLPFLLRFQAARSWKRGHPDFHGRTIIVPRAGMGADELLALVVEQLPGWQATAFPSHMILYRENREYEHGEVIARNEG